MKYLKLALTSQTSCDLVAVDLNSVVGVSLSFMFLKFATLPFSLCSSKLLVSFPPSPWKFRFDLFECFCLASVYFGLRNTISCVMARVLFLRYRIFNVCQALICGFNFQTSLDQKMICLRKWDQKIIRLGLFVVGIAGKISPHFNSTFVLN